MKYKKVTVDSISHVVTKGTTPTSIGYNFSNSGIPFLRINNIQKNGSFDLEDVLFIDEETDQALKRSRILPKDVLLSIAGTIGRSAVVPDNFSAMNCNQAVAIIRLKENTDQNYFRYWLNTEDAIRQIRGSKVTGTISNLSLGCIKSLEIPLPPIAEQKRIAAILNKADGIRRKRQEAIRLTEELGRSLFLDMFGDPVTNPKGWKIETLDKYISHSNNGLSRRRKIMQNEGKIVLRLQDIKSGYIEFSEPNRIPLNESEAKRFQLFKNDLLFVRVNGNKEYVGRCAVYQNFEEDVYHNDHIIRIQFKPELDADFLSFIFNDHSGKKIINSKIKTSAGQYTISQKGIESIEMPIPPINIQKKFKDLIKKITHKKTVYQLALQESENLFNSLLQRAFRGEL